MAMASMSLTFDQVLRAVAECRRELDVDAVDHHKKKLASPDTDPVRAVLEGTVNLIEDAIVKARTLGREAVDACLDSVDQLLRTAQDTLGDSFDELVGRIASYITKLYDAILVNYLKSLASSLATQNGNLVLGSVTLSKKMGLQGGVKASLVDLLNIVASGEMQIQLTYQFASTERPASAPAIGDDDQ